MASERFKLEIHLIELMLKLVGIPQVGGFMLINTKHPPFNYHKTLNINQNQTEKISLDLTSSIFRGLILSVDLHPHTRGFYPLTILNYTTGWLTTCCMLIL